ncbi:hypothetical protein [Pararhodobacter zhoushanensis]|nr:hypothetical protein [Pararhodobacter zhoushanensis]
MTKAAPDVQSNAGGKPVRAMTDSVASLESPLSVWQFKGAQAVDRAGH